MRYLLLNVSLKLAFRTFIKGAWLPVSSGGHCWVKKSNYCISLIGIKQSYLKEKRHVCTLVSAHVSRWSTASSLCGHRLVTVLTQLSRQKTVCLCDCGHEHNMANLKMLQSLIKKIIKKKYVSISRSFTFLSTLRGFLLLPLRFSLSTSSLLRTGSWITQETQIELRKTVVSVQRLS